MWRMFSSSVISIGHCIAGAVVFVVLCTAGSSAWAVGEPPPKQGRHMRLSDGKSFRGWEGDIAKSEASYKNITLQELP